MRNWPWNSINSPSSQREAKKKVAASCLFRCQVFIDLKSERERENSRLAVKWRRNPHEWCMFAQKKITFMLNSIRSSSNTHSEERWWRCWRSHQQVRAGSSIQLVQVTEEAINSPDHKNSNFQWSTILKPSLTCYTFGRDLFVSTAAAGENRIEVTRAEVDVLKFSN